VALSLIASAAAFADAVAARLVTEHRAALPDLSALTLVVATPALIRPLHLAFAHAAGGAVLGPRCVTAAQLAAEHLPADAPAPLTPLACRLRLAGWAARLRDVFPDQDPLSLADALYAIFDELALNAAALPDDPEQFTEQLCAAYGAPRLQPLSREAQIVHRLWRAYVEDLGARAPAVAYLAGLRAALANDTRYEWLAFDAFSRAEAALLAPALARGAVRVWSQGRVLGRDGAATRRLVDALTPNTPFDAPPPLDARAALLDAAFAEDATPPQARAATWIGRLGAHGLRLAPARNAEHEARVVELAVREALLEGAERVAVVSDDRRLARRLRALLEHAGVELEDRVGWAVTTSRAGAALAAWLDCIESGFHFQPLLDLLKCGFYVGEPLQRPEPLLAERLEREVLYAPRAEAPPLAGLRAFARAIGGAYPALFNRLRQAAEQLPATGPARPAASWADALAASLNTLGIAGGLALDEAGAQLLAALSLLREALADPDTALRLDWHGFRALLERHLEDSRYRPPTSPAPRVALYTLEQTQGLRADALILASATRAQLPGAAPGEAFFNQAVRRELGLGDWTQRQALALSRLRRVLEAAPIVTICYAAENDGDAPTPSPWIEALAAFAAAAGAPLPIAESLVQRAGRPETEVASDLAPAPLPAPPQPPRPPAMPNLPNKLSAALHQALIDCPYRYHARAALGLYEEQAPDEAAGARDYGDRVHDILRGFYVHHHPDWPPPYAGRLQPGAETNVAACLEQLADAAFAADIAENPIAQTWRQAFAALQPWLIEQLIARGEVRVSVESERRRDIGSWRLSGVIDRLEQDDDGARVVDYKTGSRIADRADVEAGEAVQLPHYALCAEADAVEYWDLKKLKIAADFDTEALPPLRDAIAVRLGELRVALDAGAALPAHGDDAVCDFCEYRGVCRRDDWSRA